MIIQFDKVIILALCLPNIWLVVQCEVSISKTECLPEYNTVKQGTQKFYCMAMHIYEELKTVSKIVDIVKFLLAIYGQLLLYVLAKS